MQVDFFLLGAEPVDRVVPQIAMAAKKRGERLLVVARDAELRQRIDRSLWEFRPELFLAHGHADGPHAARQPVLLSESCDAANGADLVAFADGEWREEGLGFRRAYLLFDDERRDAARGLWRELKGRKDIEQGLWELTEGKWRQTA